ncbi:hypothetical protein BHM03_00031677 [Ensete ventricosum]|nr:hypothetical protein BHM03_00031677 [Ensete ventricosum]
MLLIERSLTTESGAAGSRPFPRHSFPPPHSRPQRAAGPSWAPRCSRSVTNWWLGSDGGPLWSAGGGRRATSGRGRCGTHLLFSRAPEGRSTPNHLVVVGPSRYVQVNAT